MTYDSAKQILELCSGNVQLNLLFRGKIFFRIRDGVVSILLRLFEEGQHVQRYNILPRLLCATVSHSGGTCSGSGVSSVLHLQIYTAKAP